MSTSIFTPPHALFWMLLLAHLLGDYVLQPDWMAQMKSTRRGLLLHIGVHLATLLIVAGAGRSVLWPYLLALAAIHLVIDLLKNWQNKVKPSWSRAFYISDQCLHLLSLIGVAVWITASTPAALLPQYGRWMIYACAFVFVTYPVFISERVLLRDNQCYLDEMNAQRWSRMAARMAMVALFLVVAGGLRQPVSMAAMVSALPYLSGVHRWRALTTDCLAAGISALIATLAVS